MPTSPPAHRVLPAPTGDVVYQIFPDRFRNAAPENDPRPGAWTWHGQPIECTADVERLTARPHHQYTFFGGDLEGVRQSLPYLQNLGVTTLYLNPIFAARTVHRYDAIDYSRVDPALGMRADFERLAADLHACGMRLFLDGVFNHTSEDHPWHADLDTRRRFYIMQEGDRAMSWMGGGHLPKLDTQSPHVQREILAALDAWPEVDGWRLDAAHLLPHDFLKTIRDRVAPRPTIIEDWTFAPYYFRKGLADGVTNFPFREACRAFFVEDCSPETLLDRFEAWTAACPAENVRASWNFLDNHDTPRFKTLVGRARLTRALVLLFTMPGTPLIYQGTESGMDGADDAKARAPFEWDESKWDHGLLDLVRMLIRLRRETPALANGTYRPLFADNRSRTLAFERALVEQGDGVAGRGTVGDRVIVALNDGCHPCSVRIEGFEPPIELDLGEWRIANGAGTTLATGR